MFRKRRTKQNLGEENIEKNENIVKRKQESWRIRKKKKCDVIARIASAN